MTGRDDFPASPADRVPPESPPQDERTGEAPPFFGSWGTLYAAVLIFLAALVAGMYLFESVFG